jgi:hypothetical protein
MFAEVLISLVLFITLKNPYEIKETWLYVLTTSDGIKLCLSLQSVDQNVSFLANTWNEKKKKTIKSLYQRATIHQKKKDRRMDGQTERKNITERYSQEKIAILTSI